MLVQGLPINGEPVSGCFSEFDTLIHDERGRPRREWFEKIFGVMPLPDAIDPCTVTFSWLTTIFEVLPKVASEVQVCRHAEAYVMLLLSTQLFATRLLHEFLLG
ncbi:hypothetical protein PIB30_055713 [Stylosanthes scabra]|uniref:Uncharacterized protein n=1 Tax=Stylosanthes scabra TaxID=79078 RepID=A0ABU6XHS3_9FABA|nr:hypothetical protein [Stylosanthes scabra]